MEAIIEIMHEEKVGGIISLSRLIARVHHLSPKPDGELLWLEEFLAAFSLIRDWNHNK